MLDLDLDRLLDPTLRVADLEEALRDMRDAFLVRFSPIGCVPVSDWTPAEKLSRLAVARAGELVGDPEWVPVPVRTKDGPPTEPPQFARMRTLIEADIRAENKRDHKKAEQSDEE